MKKSKNIVLCWFRSDLRLDDNPAFYNASNCECVLPVYIYDNVNIKKFQIGEASKWWLYNSLISLNKSLNNCLSFYKGDPISIINNIVEEYNIKKVFWNRQYDLQRINRDKIIKKNLVESGVQVFTYNGSLLWEPWDILKADNTPYKVFTPFYRKGCLNAPEPRSPIGIPKNSDLFRDQRFSSDINDLGLLHKGLWSKKFYNHFVPGEASANKQLKEFIKIGLDDYKEGRNFPGKKNVSRLSPFIKFGEISPNKIWYSLKNNLRFSADKNTDHFLSELGWREFSYYLLFHFPKIVDTNLQEKFDNFAWENNVNFLNKWKVGQTGYPIVDAGMRELWETGYMHNRVRMIVGSFLVKNLLVDWREGEKWFWDCLLDADLASNSASWQWVAGSGADAAPYFRIFNPILQGKKFDPDGKYIKKYIPELALLPSKYLFSPWETPKDILKESDIILGKDYPNPIVDIKLSREKALNLFKNISG